MGRKRWGKRRNCSLRAISPFSTVFSKGLCPRGVKGVIVWEWVNTYKSCVTTKFWHRPDNKCNVAKMMISVLNSIENRVRKGENAGYQDFLLSPQCFHKIFVMGLCGKELGKNFQPIKEHQMFWFQSLPYYFNYHIWQFRYRVCAV